VRSARPYTSPKRDAQAAATRKAILDAFAEQISDPGRDTLSPKEAAARAGVSLRTVHVHFPNEASQIAALGEWIDTMLFPEGVVVCAGPDDLVRYFRDIHRMALRHPVFLRRWLPLAKSSAFGREVRDQRRVKRLAAIREAVKAIGAPPRETEAATAMLLSLSGADASLPLHDYGLPLEQAPDVIARTVELIVSDLREKAGA
jgi:AcrR family transcriptional regulator